MKILLYSFNCNFKCYLGLLLEFVNDHLEKGDDVYIVKCNGELEYCVSNVNNKKQICKNECQKCFDLGIKLLNNPKINIIDFPIKNISYKDIPETFENTQELMKFTLEGVEIGLAATSTFVAQLRDHEFDTLKNKDMLNKALKASYFVYKNSEEIFNNIKPDLVYALNPRHTEKRPIVNLCQLKNVSFNCYDIFDNFNTYVLTRNEYIHDLNYAKQEINYLWENAKDNKEEIGESFYFKQQKQENYSYLNFLKDQIPGYLPKNFDPSKTNIAVFNSSLCEFYAFPEYKNSMFFNQIEVIRTFVKHFNFRNDLVFYLRIHPNLGVNKNSTQMKEIYELSKESHSNLKIIMPEDAVDTYTLMINCDKVITFGSTVGAEANFHGKPSILLGRAPYESLDCSYIPDSFDELYRLIENDIAPKDKINSTKYGHYWIKRSNRFKHYKLDDFGKTSFKNKSLDFNESKFSIKKLYKFLNQLLKFR
jgi:hypothetical protein